MHGKIVMNATISIDSVLAPLAPAFRQRADVLLDLRENVHQGKNPGGCIASYFELRKGIRGVENPGLGSLRTWLEDHLEIVAKDAAGQQLETLPLSLRENSLENYCASIIRDFQEDRVYKTPSIGISFRYRLNYIKYHKKLGI
jgi:hypothetical protein